MTPTDGNTPKKDKSRNSAAIFTIACGLWTILRTETTLCRTVYVKRGWKSVRGLGANVHPRLFPLHLLQKNERKNSFRSPMAQIFHSSTQKNERQTKLLLLLYSQNIPLEIPHHIDERFPVPTHRYGRAAGKKHDTNFYILRYIISLYIFITCQINLHKHGDFSRRKIKR